MTDDRIPLRRHGIAQVEAYEVTVQELKSIRKTCADVGLDFQLAQFFLTVAISFAVTLLTIAITSPRKFAVFFCTAAFSGFLSLVFGFKWWKGRRSMDDVFDEILRRQIGPVGDADHNLTPADLAQMEPTQASPQMNLAPPGSSQFPPTGTGPESSS